MEIIATAGHDTCAPEILCGAQRSERLSGEKVNVLNTQSLHAGLGSAGLLRYFIRRAAGAPMLMMLTMFKPGCRLILLLGSVWGISCGLNPPKRERQYNVDNS
jgi:hypothetical protein